jgi:hypothetical protein
LNIFEKQVKTSFGTKFLPYYGQFWAIFSWLKFCPNHWAIFSRKKFAQRHKKIAQMVKFRPIWSPCS